MTVCLDAWALLAWAQDEAPAAHVERLLAEGEATGDAAVISAINLGEVYCQLVRGRGEDTADALWNEITSAKMPLVVVAATSARVRAAARLKARYAISYADAFAVSTAVASKAILATGDPEIQVVASDLGLELDWLRED